MLFKSQKQMKLSKQPSNHSLTVNNKLWEKNYASTSYTQSKFETRVKNENGLKYLRERNWWDLVCER